MNTSKTLQAITLELYEFPWSVDDREPVVDIALDAVPGMGAPALLALTRVDLVAMLSALDDEYCSDCYGGRS
jgi:hypothetical protein